MSPPQTVPQSAERSIGVTVDLALLDFQNPTTDLHLRLEILTDGEWHFDAGCHYIGGPHRNRDGSLQTRAGFRIPILDRNLLTGEITRDLRGVTVRVGVKSETPLVCGIALEFL